MKKKIFICLLFLSMFLGFNHVHAQNNYQDCTKGFKLNYHYNNGQNDDNVWVNNNGIFGITTPSRDGYDFAGWYYDSNLTIPVYATYEKDLDSRYKTTDSTGCKVSNIYAKWVPNSSNKFQDCTKGFRLNYHYNNGQNDDNVWVNNNGIFGITTPSKEGYNFAGWYYDYNLTIPVYATYEKDLDSRYKTTDYDGCKVSNIYAKWEQKVMTEQDCGGFSVRYQTLDNTAVQEIFVKTNDTSVYLKTPTRSGYKFLGWYYDPNFTVPVTDSRAAYLSNTYKIKANASCPTVNVYAKWEKEVPQVVTEESCGGFNVRYQTLDNTAVKEVFVKSNDQTSTIYTPTRSGYKFLGWFYDPDFKVAVNTTRLSSLSDTYKIKANASCPTVNIYAKWEKQEEKKYITEQSCSGFNISYHINDNNKSINTIFAGLNANNTLYTPTKTGYTFAGWYYDANLNVSVSGNNYNSLATKYLVYSYTECPVMHLYAKWTKVEEAPKVITEEYCGGFNIRFQTNDGNAAQEVFVKTANVNQTLYTPERNGYKFVGWYYDYNLTVPVTDIKVSKLSDTYKIKSNGSCPTMNLYAKWERVGEAKPINETTISTEPTCNGFNLRYYTNDGTEPVNISVSNNMTSLYLIKPIRDGYKFIGWYYDNNLTVPVTEDKAINLSNNYKIYDNTTCPYINLYAKWEKIEDEKSETTNNEVKCNGFNLRYYLNDGSNPINVSVGYNMSSLEIITPVREGYTFNGWYYDEALTNRVYTAKVINLSQTYLVKNTEACPYINLYAKWIKKYEIGNVSVSLPESMLTIVSNIDIKVYDDPNKLNELMSYSELKEVTFSAYEIDIYDLKDNKIQPNGMVQISFEIPDNLKNTKLIVYRVDGNKLVPYTVKIIDNKAVIETDHFSTYILAEKKSSVLLYIFYYVLGFTVLGAALVYIGIKISRRNNSVA